MNLPPSVYTFKQIEYKIRLSPFSYDKVSLSFKYFSVGNPTEDHKNHVSTSDGKINQIIHPKDKPKTIFRFLELQSEA